MNNSNSIARYIGLDVHKRQITFCILSAAGQVLARGQIPTTAAAIKAFATAHLQPTDHIALEATTNCWAVVELLEPHVAKVVVSNPLTTRAIAYAKIKTDKIDARVLADLLRCNYLPQVWQPDPQTLRLRRLTHRRAALCADRTAIKNRIHATLAMNLIQAPLQDLFSTKGIQWLQNCTTDPELDPDTRAALASDLRLLQAVQAEIDALDQQLATLAYTIPQVKLLMTLPGVDYPTALALLAAWGTVQRFSTPAQAASYLGLSPSTRQSDLHCYHGPITKHGNPHARWMLVQAAQHADRHPGPLGVFFRRIAHKKNRNVAVVATARKLATIAWHMLQDNQPYWYALPRPTETKLARLRVRATGQKRKPGTPKGQKAMSNSPDGGRTRTIKALPQLYHFEGLPQMHVPKPAEQRALAAMGLAEFVSALGKHQVIKRATNSHKNR